MIDEKVVEEGTAWEVASLREHRMGFALTQTQALQTRIVKWASAS